MQNPHNNLNPINTSLINNISSRINNTNNNNNNNNKEREKQMRTKETQKEIHHQNQLIQQHQIDQMIHIK